MQSSAAFQKENYCGKRNGLRKTARIIMGSLTGACLGVAGNVSVWLAAVLGAIGALVGAFGGYRARVGLVRALHAPDFAIAIPEDLVAIDLSVFLISRF